ncbi:MAG: hypothetical protein AAGI17_10125 [Planctomycetota bacterium]
MLAIALSPYHLTTREAAAMASIVLADHVVTMLPTPFTAGVTVSKNDVGRAVQSAPEYLEFIESWAWAAPLFEENVLGSVFQGEDASGDVRAACELVNDDDRFGPLRPLMRQALFEDEASYLAAVARDVLKAGPDPGISVPVAAGLDSFAARHGLLVARAEPSSVAQKTESRLATPMFGVAIPALVQASADRLLLARALLEEELIALRDAMLDAIDAGGDVNAVREAASAYADAFDREREDLLSPPGAFEEDEVRTIAGTVTVQAQSMPVDAVLRSSAAAARSLQNHRESGEGVATGEGLVSLVIKVVGRGRR